MTNEQWGVILFVTFITVLVLTLIMSCITHLAISLMRQSISRRRFDFAAGSLVFSALLMWVGAQPGLLQEQDQKRLVFWGGLVFWGVYCAVEAMGWWSIRSGLLQRRARERIIRRGGSD